MECAFIFLGRIAIKEWHGVVPDRYLMSIACPWVSLNDLVKSKQLPNEYFAPIIAQMPNVPVSLPDLVHH